VTVTPGGLADGSVCSNVPEGHGRRVVSCVRHEEK